MQRQGKRIILGAVALALISFAFIFVVGSQPSIHAAHMTLFMIPRASVTPFVASSSSAKSSNVANWSSSPLIGTLIALGGLIVAIWTTIYQVRRSERLQRELTHQNEQLQRELAQQNEQMQRELVRTQKELEREYTARERQEQQKQILKAAEVKKQQMLTASSNEERVHLYCKALREDPRIATLQILEMKRPLELVNVYVRLRIHQDMLLRPERDLLQQAQEPARDPNDLFLADYQWQKTWYNTSIDPEEAIQKYLHCVIVGDPGAGKTTLLKYLALTAATQPLTGFVDLFPIYIDVYDFINSGLRDLLDFAAVTLDGLYAFPHEEARTYIGNRLYEGTALLLLDGLDETAAGETADTAERAYAFVSQAILQVATRYRKAPIVVTARKASYQRYAPLAGFTHLDILDFRPTDIQEFITKWYTYSHDPHKQTKISGLNARLKQNPRIQTLAANPLLLSLIVLVYEAQLDLPDRRASLYKRCIDTLLLEWDARRNIHRHHGFKSEQKQQLLEVIAWHFHQQRQRYFPEQELLRVIAGFLPAIGVAPDDHHLILKEIATEHGILKEQAPGWYGFVHLTLQEYLVARYATDHNQREVLLKHYTDPWWEEVILLYAGAVPDASAFLAQLLSLENIRKSLFATNPILACHCLAMQPILYKASLRTTVIDHLFDLLCRTPYSLIQTQAAEALAGLGSPEVSLHLVKLLSHEKLDKIVRARIALALGKLREHGVIPDLVRLLSDEKLSRIVRGNIADALGMLGEHEVASNLVYLLSDDKLNLTVRGRIAKALGNLGERAVISDLVRLLSDEKLDKHVCGWITEALAKLEAREVVSDLVQLLSDKRLDKEVRGYICWTLGELGEQRVIPDLVRLLSDETLDMTVRARIAEALGKLGERTVATDLVSSLSDNTLDRNMAGYIGGALSGLGERKIIPNLLQLLSDDTLDVTVRGRIAWTLGELGDREVIPNLLQLLSDDTLNVVLRGWITEALGVLGERTVIPDLVQLLSNEGLDKQLRGWITEALAELKAREVASDLVHVLSDKRLDNEVRGYICWALKELGEQRVIPDLVGLFSDETLDMTVQKRIAEALGKLVDDERTVHTLALMLLSSTFPDRADEIHKMLWMISQRMGMSLFLSEESGEPEIDIVKWETASS